MRQHRESTGELDEAREATQSLRQTLAELQTAAEQSSATQSVMDAALRELEGYKKEITESLDQVKSHGQQLTLAEASGFSMEAMRRGLDDIKRVLMQFDSAQETMDNTLQEIKELKRELSEQVRQGSIGDQVPASLASSPARRLASHCR